jgi:cytochrome c-type biogenesis protein CcmH/NrfG
MSVAGAAYDAEELLALAALGHALLAEGRLEDARGVWEGLVEIAPRDEAGFRALAVIAARERRWEDVEMLATAALGRRPGAVALVLRAEARWRTGRYAAAAADLEAVVRVDEAGADGLGEALRRRAAALLARLRRPGG